VEQLASWDEHKSWNFGVKEMSQMHPLLCSGLLKHVSVAVNAHSNRGRVGDDVF
jgi:hypothetical protein